MKEGNTEEWIPGFLIKNVVIFEQFNLKNKNKIRESLNRHIKRVRNKEERIMTRKTSEIYSDKMKSIYKRCEKIKSEEKVTKDGNSEKMTFYKTYNLKKGK